MLQQPGSSPHRSSSQCHWIRDFHVRRPPGLAPIDLPDPVSSNTFSHMHSRQFMVAHLLLHPNNACPLLGKKTTRLATHVWLEIGLHWDRV